MNIGVICEGHTDRAVIENILKGLKNVDSSQVVALRPQSDFDETDLSDMNVDSFGGWSAVKKECESRTKIDEFLSLEGNDFIVIQIDSIESEEYGVPQPVKDKNFCAKLRSDIVNKIDEWLKDLPKSVLLYAVAIGETEAWILAQHDSKDSSRSADPKSKLKTILGKKNIRYSHTTKDFKEISSGFTNKRNYSKFKYFTYNQSLEDFCTEINQKVPEAK